MTELQFKDVAHLYVNQFNPIKVLVDGGKIKWLRDISVASDDGNELYINITVAKMKFETIELEDSGWDVLNDNGTLSRIKPLLRPLTDEFTEQEKAEFKKLPILDRNVYDINRQRAHETLFLLSKHYDLFDLIERGLAIDCTTLNPNPYE